MESSENRENIQMYFDPEVTKHFAQHEQNEKNFTVANIVDATIMQEMSEISDPLYVAELGGGAHPDRYHSLFDRLLEEPQGKIDWVDISPHMLVLAKEYISDEKYLKRKEVINFVASEILEYLKNLEDEILDLAIMKYTIDHIEDLDELFKLLSLKLKTGGRLVSGIGTSSPVLKSISTNARFLYKGEEFPEDETRILKEGETFTIKFFKISGKPSLGYIEGAETTKYFHSAEKIKNFAKKNNFEVFLGNWKEFVKQENQRGIEQDQEILVLTKKNVKFLKLTSSPSTTGH